jgi:hypothetical protein
LPVEGLFGDGGARERERVVSAGRPLSAVPAACVGGDVVADQGETAVKETATRLVPAAAVAVAARAAIMCRVFQRLVPRFDGNVAGHQQRRFR